MRRAITLFIVLIVAVIWGYTMVRSQTAPTCRDPITWPFAQNSIWNMPIGSGASFVNANFKLPANGYGAEENVIIMTPNAPLRTMIAMSSGGWDGGSQQPRCNSSGQTMYGGKQFPIPNDFVTLNRLSGGTPNASAAILDRDGKTLYQNQPFTICSAGGTVLSKYPYPDDNIVTGDGIKGAQGGSGMSSLGGAIRINEMVPGSVIRHALKLVIYGEENMHFDTGADKGWRWPAWKHDGGARPAGCPGGTNQYCGTNSALKIGALLALPSTVDINSLGLQTETGKMIARAMQDYGGYVVDNSAWSHVGIAVEFGPAGDGRAKWNSIGGFNKADLDKVFSRLAVVNNNNDPSSAGGGGTPRAPLAPPFCGPGQPTNPPTNPTQPPVGTCAKKAQGDADCNGTVTLADYQIWRTEFQGTQTTKRADFNNDTKVSLVDYQIWRTTFKGGGTNPTNPPNPTTPPNNACIGGGGATVKIMPLGDSVTGGLDTNSYRKPLYEALTGNGQKVDFVGSVKDGSFADTDHEGHGGWCMDDINNHCQRDWAGAGGLSENIVNWLNTYDPQLILLNIGINDGACTPGNEQHCTDAARQTRFKAFIDKIYATKPNVKIVVSHLSFRDSAWTVYNNSLTSVVNTVKATGKDIRVFNSYAGLTSGDFADGAHPSTAGNTKMGQNWFNEIKGMICK